MSYIINLDKMQFDIPIWRPHPGYWICSLIFLISSFSIGSRIGIMQAIPPFAVAVLLPLLSYWIRTGQPHKIEIDKSSRSVTQIFMRFGKTRKVTIDLHRFNIVKIQVRNSRFPKAILILSESDKSNNDLELACADIDIVNFGIRKINKTLHVFDDIASTLEVNFGFINHCG